MPPGAIHNLAKVYRLQNTCCNTVKGPFGREVRRMHDPRHPTKIGRLEEALARFGKRLVITVEAAA